MEIENINDLVTFFSALLELPTLVVIAAVTTAAVLFCQLLSIAVVIAVSPDDRKSPIDEPETDQHLLELAAAHADFLEARRSIEIAWQRPDECARREAAIRLDTACTRYRDARANAAGIVDETNTEYLTMGAIAR
jgi:hypothetical protein